MKAVLFDFDGTLVDTQHLYNKALSQVLLKFNSVYTVEYCTKFFDGKCWNDAFDALSIQENFNKNSVFNEGLAVAHELISKHATPTKGTILALRILQKYGVKYAICSNSHTKEIHSVLKQTELSQFFENDSIFGREMVEKGKPESDIYLLAMEKLALSPQNCISVEDSINGAKSGLNAGIQTIIFTGGTGFLGIDRFQNELSPQFGEISSIESILDVVKFIGMK
jgi:HAD superfamily hydrolase (TIGR01509 family)